MARSARRLIVASMLAVATAGCGGGEDVGAALTVREETTTVPADVDEGTTAAPSSAGAPTTTGVGGGAPDFEGDALIGAVADHLVATIGIDQGDAGCMAGPILAEVGEGPIVATLTSSGDLGDLPPEAARALEAAIADAAGFCDVDLGAEG